MKSDTLHTMGAQTPEVTGHPQANRRAGAAPAVPGLALTRVSAAEQVAELLTTQILEGVLGAGERLRESALATQLGISRNSVREGIRLLEQSRLVRYEMHRGAVVATPSVEELDDLYVTRKRLEGAAAAVTPDAEQLAALHRAFDHFIVVAERGQAREIVAADLAFHAEMVSLLGSRRIDEFYAGVSTEMGYYLMLLSYVDHEHERPWEMLVPHHRELLDALGSGRPEVARAAIEQHLDENHARIRQILLDT